MADKARSRILVRLTQAMAGAIAVFSLLLMVQGVRAADSRAITLNQNTIGVEAGEPRWLPHVNALAKAINHRDGLRILPMASNGSLQALQDVTFLDGVDAAIIPADSLHYAEAQGLQGAGTISYLAQMSTLPVLMVARNDLQDISALAGQRISTGPAQSAAFATGELLLGALGIPFTRVAASGEDAISALKRGEADAALLLGSFETMTALDAKRFHALSVPVPQGFETVYAPSLYRTEDLHGVPVADRAGETVSVPLVLAVFNWARDSAQSKSLVRFARALFSASSAGELKDVSAETNFAADVSGWQRHAAARQALADIRKAAEAVPPTTEPSGGQP